MKTSCCALSILVFTFAEAFVPLTFSSTKSNSVFLELSKENGGNRDSSRSKKPKRRRFAQEVEPIVSFVPFSEKSTKSPVKKSTSSNSSDGDARGKSMLQNTKSIEELENIMTKRWGLSEEKWVADFSEWEIDEEESNVETTATPPTRKIRSRAVLNPWDKEERRNKQEEQQVETAEENRRKNIFRDANERQNDVLNRVKKNQQRLQDQKQTKRLEFYDEDDEGFEPEESYYANDDDMDFAENDFYTNIISPKPAGGSGSFKGGESSASSGYFFNSPSIINMEGGVNTEKENNEQKKKDKLKKVLGKPMLDETGKEIYLTLEQAKRNSEQFATDVSVHDDDRLEKDKISSWEDIGITHPILLKNLRSMGCNTPLPVQDIACPPIVSGNDVLVSTHTGSGKTLSFLAPLAERILFETTNNSGGVKVIVIAPGRELASQIVAVARDLLNETGLTSMLAIGGTPFSRNYDQIRKKKPDILIGTPGRIAELVVGQPGDKGGKLKISNVQAVVLDECDALLEYEPHKDPTAAIINVLKRRHGESLQSILCSATAGDLMGKSLLDGILRQGYAHAQTNDDDNLVTSGSGQTTRVSRTAMHGVVHVPHKRFVLDTLKKILYTEPIPQQVLIFVDNSRRVGIVVDKLAEMGIIAAPLHGGSGSEKSDRTEVNKLFREGYIGLVVATEMAARGIDAPFLTHVINLDLPTDASHYAHRAGRCARGGRPGIVINIAVGAREKNVPLKFAKALDIQMHITELQSGKLVVVEDKGKESIPQD
jgi:ATP-dependent RNA helicase DeaD